MTKWKWRVGLEGFWQKRFKLIAKIKGAFKRVLTKEGNGNKQEKNVH